MGCAFILDFNFSGYLQGLWSLVLVHGIPRTRQNVATKEIYRRQKNSKQSRKLSMRFVSIAIVPFAMTKIGLFFKVYWSHGLFLSQKKKETGAG